MSQAEDRTPDPAEGDPPRTTVAPAQQTPSRRTLPRQVLEWFTRSEALDEVRGTLDAEARVASFKRHAAAALEVGQRILRPIEPIQGNGALVALEAFIQATFWSLAAIAGSPANSRAEAWNRLDAVGVPQKDLELLARVFVANDRVRGELSDTELSVSLKGFEELATRLVRTVHEPDTRLKALRAQRGLRSGVAALLVCIAAGYGIYRASRGVDLASVATWRASSTLDGCTPEAHKCQGKPFSAFFHTKDEDSPWLEYDFDGRRRISRVVVQNRRDCCKERAIPLLVEVSDDRKTWRKVAERKNEFDEVTLSFAPTSARYLRLRVPKTTALHLHSVRIYR